MKLTKQETQKLADILSNLKTAQKYISKEEIRIINTNYKTGFKEDIYTNGTGVQVGVNIDKEIGSDIVYLRNAIQKLEYFLYPPQIETENCGGIEATMYEICKPNGITIGDANTKYIKSF